MTFHCHVCTQPVTPDAEGHIRLEGITRAGPLNLWIWGPVVVHDECRVSLRTPYDGQPHLTATWQRVHPHEVELIIAGAVGVRLAARIQTKLPPIGTLADTDPETYARTIRDASIAAVNELIEEHRGNVDDDILDRIQAKITADLDQRAEQWKTQDNRWPTQLRNT